MILCPHCLTKINKEREEAAQGISCPNCKQRFDNLSTIPTVKLFMAISLISIRTKAGEELAKMIPEAIGRVS
jgi:hypothetical protein